jgi:serine/threonine protein kinase/Tol biopolymer transport system component
MRRAIPMRLNTGTAVGPYEIVAPIGAGGMGEVYRARDPRIGRDVAVKVLPAAASSEPERQRRFEQEARAAGALNHPNVLAVYDVGTHEGVPYIVSELLAGETLRTRMGGTALRLRKALDYAVQTARGLAAAHEKGIVHRDLKPENLFVTKDGRVKILDFGLAKLGPEAPVPQTAPGPEFSAVETATGTLPGTLLGTLGYMSPEQVQGHAADARSDIFAFGTVLYEMVTGRRAFKAETAPETLTAILKADPFETAENDVTLAPGLERVLRHCLEKSPEERFQSARDLAFALEALSGVSEAGSRRTAPRRRERSLVALVGAVVLAAVLGLAAGWGLWHRERPRSSQLTFRSGLISAARFSPDGRAIVYSAAWDGGPLELYVRRLGDRASRPLGLRGARVLSISRSGEVAVLLLDEDSARASWLVSGGTLARIPLAGGKPREILEDTLSADWSPDGRELAVSRRADGVYRLEYPIGHVLHESEDRIPVVRVSPDGDLVAFSEEVSVAGSLFNTLRLSVVGRDGEKKDLFEGWGIVGLGWSPSGQEIWVNPYAGDGARSLRAVDLTGESRLVTQLGGAEGHLADISREGRALYVEHHGRYMIFARPPGADRERNLSWRHDSSLVDISRDGRLILFNEVLSGAGRSFRTSLRGTDGSPAVRLGEGYGFALSPDNRWALAFTGKGPTLEFVLLPTGAGEAKRLGEEVPADCFGADWLPDSRGFVFSGSAPGEAARVYQQDIDGGPPRPLTPDGVDLFAPVVSPDGSAITAIDLYGEIVRISFPDGEVQPVPGVAEQEIPIRWRTDAQALYVYRPDTLPVQIFEVTVASGRRRLIQQITQPGIQGADGNVVVALTPDAQAYAYSFYRPLDELYVIEGLE